MIADNHNSVHGMREYCTNAKGKYRYAPLNFKDLTINETILKKQLEPFKDTKNKLFAFPAQSNVSGVKHDLKWVEIAQKNGWDVCLDAAAFAPTNSLDLQKIKPDFLTLSFYKIFGYPTGLGCLLVKKSTFNKLHKRWFAGGTVQYASVSNPFYFLEDGYERFENGTTNYLDIPAIAIGLNFIKNIGMQRINERVSSMTAYLFSRLSLLTYEDRTRFISFYKPSDRKHTGGTIIMNFFKPNGDLISVYEVEALANERNISLRSGCFCNPGIDELNNKITNDGVEQQFFTTSNNDREALVQGLKDMRGATRVSVGIPTTQKGLNYFMNFVKEVRDIYS